MIKMKLSTRDVAKIAAQAIRDGWEVNLVADSSPVFIDGYGREVAAPMMAFKGTSEPEECHNYHQVQAASWSPMDVSHHRVLYIRSDGNDVTPIKMQRWEQEVLGHLSSMGLAELVRRLDP